MKSIFLIVALSSALVACSNGGSSTDSKEVVPENQAQSKSVDVTDRSICQGQTPSDVSLVSNDWTARHLAKNGVVLDRTMHFASNSVEVTIKATYENNSRQIRVRSALSSKDGGFEILNTDSDQATLPTGNDTFKLSFELKPMAVNYTFVGPCLKIDTGADTLVLVPQKD